MREKGGLVWAYRGPPELEPAFPQYPWFDVPDSNRINAYAVDNCNYVQVFEALVDSSASDTSCTWMVSGHRANSKNLNFAAAADMAFDAGPRIEVDDTDFGFHYAALRGGELPGPGCACAHNGGHRTILRRQSKRGPVDVKSRRFNHCQCVHFHVFFHPERRMN